MNNDQQANSSQATTASAPIPGPGTPVPPTVTARVRVLEVKGGLAIINGDLVLISHEDDAFRSSVETPDQARTRISGLLDCVERASATLGHKWPPPQERLEEQALRADNSDLRKEIERVCAERDNARGQIKDLETAGRGYRYTVVPIVDGRLAILELGKVIGTIHIAALTYTPVLKDELDQERRKSANLAELLREANRALMALIPGGYSFGQ